MSSSSSTTNSNSYRRCLERGVKCKCGILAPCWEAWKNGTRDPGRRFYGCSRYKDPHLRCNFFQWAEPQYTERGREVIEDLRMKLSVKCDELRLSYDLSLAEKEVSSLKEKLLVAETKNKETVELLKMKDKELEKLKKLFVLLALICCIFPYLFLMFHERV
ncbi:GRF-type domain-containing protein [Heracleum sosnowskyi]|uniref:GRF-type domain-containing protein n=1 Tax=Heracleum sosnowskyi TaxID=360622 RepID=A0AAD8IG70_9APIA|nr:GRF-type domain-containing protein [Heracleum sosnowskyi]